MQRKKMFVVVCISTLLTGVVRGQNFLQDTAKSIPVRPGWSQKGHEWNPKNFFLLPAQPAPAIPANRVVTHFGFFCRKELELEKTIHLPLRFRLGSLEYCNKLEGK